VTLSLRGRLFLNGLVILLLGMGLAGMLFWQAAARLYLNTQTENLLAQARLTAASLQGETLPVIQIEPYSQVSNVMPGLHTRVLSEQGAVLIGRPQIESNQFVQLPAAENNSLVSPQELLQRSEIKAALQGIASSAVREVLPEKYRVLYAAAPIFAENGSVNGLVYLAVPLPSGGVPAEFFWQAGGAVLAAIGLALLAGTLLARRVTRPVEAITRGAAAVSEGDLNQRVPVDSGIPEVDTLGYAFNRMVADLQQSDQAQNAFVADVAHELRTPLTVIKGTIETLEDGALDDREGRGPLLVSMQRETDRLIRLVNDLLILTRADAGMLKLKIAPLNLRKLAEQRCDQLSGLAGRRGVTFSVSSSGVTEIQADEDRLAQVLDNLMNNAVRYSPPGGTICVGVHADSVECRCEVRDSGTGIPQKHLPHIFDRFFRVESARNRQGGEAGLGLSIARALVQAHGGRIYAESTPGVGTTVGFSIPIARDLNVI
jgi:signal transduction histidine kinase